MSTAQVVLRWVYGTMFAAMVSLCAIDAFNGRAGEALLDGAAALCFGLALACFEAAIRKGGE